MPKIVPIVEGPGEVEAVPILLHKLLAELERYDIQIATPKNAHGRYNLEKPGGLEKFIQLCWTERDCGAILVLMDADKQCPYDLARGFAKRVQALGLRYPVAVVIANCEYEAWFLASLESLVGQDLRGRPGLPGDLSYPDDVEARVGGKGWLTRQFPEGRIYKETEDQAALTRLLDTNLARHRSRSFRRLSHAVAEAVQAIDAGQTFVTPTAA